MSKTKVLFAYCHELKKVVSVNDARTEFFSIRPEERKRFTFSCSDRNCNVLIDWPLESPDTSCHLLRDSLNTGFQTGCWSSDDRCFRA